MHGGRDLKSWFHEVVEAVSGHARSAGLDIRPYHAQGALCRTWRLSLGEKEAGTVDVRLSSEAEEGERYEGRPRFVVYLYAPSSLHDYQRRHFRMDGVDVMTSGMDVSDPNSFRQGMNRIAAGLAAMARDAGVDPPRMTTVVLTAHAVQVTATMLIETLGRVSRRLERGLVDDWDVKGLEATMHYLLATGMVPEDIAGNLRSGMAHVHAASTRTSEARDA